MEFDLTQPPVIEEQQIEEGGVSGIEKDVVGLALQFENILNEEQGSVSPSSVFFTLISDSLGGDLAEAFYATIKTRNHEDVTKLINTLGKLQIFYHQGNHLSNEKSLLSIDKAVALSGILSKKKSSQQPVSSFNIVVAANQGKLSMSIDNEVVKVNNVPVKTIFGVPVMSEALQESLSLTGLNLVDSPRETIAAYLIYLAKTYPLKNGMYGEMIGSKTEIPLYTLNKEKKWVLTPTVSPKLASERGRLLLSKIAETYGRKNIMDYNCANNLTHVMTKSISSYVESHSIDLSLALIEDFKSSKLESKSGKLSFTKGSVILSDAGISIDEFRKSRPVNEPFKYLETWDQTFFPSATLFNKQYRVFDAMFKKDDKFSLCVLGCGKDRYYEKLPQFSQVLSVITYDKESNAKADYLGDILSETFKLPEFKDPAIIYSDVPLKAIDLPKMKRLVNDAFTKGFKKMAFKILLGKYDDYKHLQNVCEGWAETRVVRILPGGRPHNGELYVVIGDKENDSGVEYGVVTKGTIAGFLGIYFKIMHFVNVYRNSCYASAIPISREFFEFISRTLVKNKFIPPSTQYAIIKKFAVSANADIENDVIDLDLFNPHLEY